MQVSVPQKILDSVRGRLRYTTISSDGNITVKLPGLTVDGHINDSDFGFYISLNCGKNDKLFKIADVSKVHFCSTILGYATDDGDWPWMRSLDDIVKILLELDRRYIYHISDEEAEEESHEEVELHPKPLDFTPKKKHYSFNFEI